MATPEASAYFRGLRQLSEAVHEGRRLKPLLSGLMDRASALPGVDTVRVLLVDHEGQVLVPQPGTFPDSAGMRPIPIGVGFAGRIAQSRRPLLVSDLSEFPVYSRALDAAGLRSVIGVPLLVGEKLLGVLHIGSRRPGRFGAEMIPELVEVAERVALTVEAIQAEAAQAESELRFRTLFEDAPIGVCLIDLRPVTVGRILLANAALSDIAGYPIEQLATMNALDLLAPEQRADAETSMSALASGQSFGYAAERRLIRADGTAVWVVGSVSAVAHEEERSFAVSYIQDVTARKMAESDLARRAFTDNLTGLANRPLVMDHLELALRHEVRSGLGVGVLYLDVDHFKNINDAYGHDVGDRVLREIAARLRAGMRAADTPGRIGGDEFIVVCPQLSGDEELTGIAGRLMEAVSAPVSLANGPSIDVAVSIGLAAGTRNDTPEELVRRADVAMYEAKRQGRRRWHSYSPALDQGTKERLAVELLLRDALEHDWFRLYYQPIIDLSTNDAVSFEALLRIQHPGEGLLEADTFISHLEESELSEQIETWVLTRAFQDWAASGGPADTGLAVNVSGQLASSGHLCETVLAAAGDFTPNRLSIEMTERGMVHGGTSVVADLQSLTQHGVGIAIDDFGTGYASLTYLKSLPVNIVKIDRSFVAGLGQNSRDAAIVRAVVALGDSLDMSVIAEGVETEDQAAALRSAGCPLAQGFLFGHPNPLHLIQSRSCVSG
jgi:diguanylate cyclase (GGDEF)-like protein/PAS domain S-box-containing protein